MFSHYSSFMPLVLVLFVWGTFVTLCVTVTNIFNCSYMAMSSLTYIPIMEIRHTFIKDHPLKQLNQIKRHMAGMVLELSPFKMGCDSPTLHSR
jgi:hypothetical protein